MRIQEACLVDEYSFESKRRILILARISDEEIGLYSKYSAQ